MPDEILFEQEGKKGDRWNKAPWNKHAFLKTQAWPKPIIVDWTVDQVEMTAKRKIKWKEKQFTIACDAKWW